MDDAREKGRKDVLDVLLQSKGLYHKALGPSSNKMPKGSQKCRMSGIALRCGALIYFFLRSLYKVHWQSRLSSATGFAHLLRLQEFRGYHPSQLVQVAVLQQWRLHDAQEALCSYHSAQEQR